MDNKRVDCFKCKFFYITWDQRYPKGCRAFEFKTSRLPSLDVYRASGQRCLRFEKKN
ncbi:uracil-DNA glycosylase [Bacillus mesophilum]|uniref:Uracil-DNA glycosylase n=1 Tax=Bacillus mesophilum TaxID=1071718 RepID=A0A7V7RL89_9BACI|nr:MULTISPECIES: uracil-DNA glycosylase [Bacillaceae]KAB2332454.1 uracil-DNA glycosylase [Bacillus mesophilum]